MFFIRLFKNRLKILYKFKINQQQNRMCSKKPPNSSKSEDNEDVKVKFAKRLLADSKIYKGLAFTKEERQLFNIHGVLPPAILTLDNQLQALSKIFEDSGNTPLAKFLRAMYLYDLNKKLFFKFAQSHLEQILPILYIPFFSDICMDYSLIFSRVRCLYITINDKGKVKSILKNWPYKNIKLIIMSDGELGFGIGDLGVNCAPICVGRNIIYTTVAGLSPDSCIRIVLDVGTDNETFLKDRFYNGLRQKRVRGSLFHSLLDEIIKSIREEFGENVVIHMENNGSKSHLIIERYKNDICIFNNDFQSIAAVVIAGIFTAVKILKKEIKDLNFLFFGAGVCNLGIGRFLKYTLIKHGMIEEEALNKIFFMDTLGLITKDRKFDVDSLKLPFARDLKPDKDLISVIKTYKPDVLIGAVGVGGIFNKEVLECMAKEVETPVIFALSNPINRSECTAEEALKYTDGRCIFASGSPFKPVIYKEKTYSFSQANTYYINTIGMAANLAGIKSITNELLLKAAYALGECVTQENIDAKLIYPPISKMRDVATHLIVQIMQYAYDNHLATIFPEPKDKKEFYLSKTYKTSYEDVNFYKELFNKSQNEKSNKTKQN